MKKFLAVLALAVFFVTLPATEATDLEQSVFSMVNSYWEAVDAAATEDFQLYEEHYDRAIRQADEIADMIAQQIGQNDPSAYQEFVRLYQDMNSRGRTELREPLNLVADRLRDMTPDSYFPGYGYADPDFVYRRGEELESTVLSVYWKQIEKTVEAGKKYKFMIEVGLSANLGANATVVELGTVQANIGGEMKEMMEIEVTYNETTKTTCTVKFQKKKVWFTLYKAEKTWWGMSHDEWQECGKTYSMFEEESGLPVIETPNQPSPTA